MGLSMRTADGDLGMNGHGPASGDEAHSQPSAEVGISCQALYSLSSACWLAYFTTAAEQQQLLSESLGCSRTPAAGRLAGALLLRACCPVAEDCSLNATPAPQDPHKQFQIARLHNTCGLTDPCCTPGSISRQAIARAQARLVPMPDSEYTASIRHLMLVFRCFVCRCPHKQAQCLSLRTGTEPDRGAHRAPIH